MHIWRMNSPIGTHIFHHRVLVLNTKSKNLITLPLWEGE